MTIYEIELDIKLHKLIFNGAKTWIKSTEIKNGDIATIKDNDFVIIRPYFKEGDALTYAVPYIEKTPNETIIAVRQWYGPLYGKYVGRNCDNCKFFEKHYCTTTGGAWYCRKNNDVDEIDEKPTHCKDWCYGYPEYTYID